MQKLNKQMTKIINKCCGLNITATLTSNFWMSEKNQLLSYSLVPDKCDKDFCDYVNKTFGCNFQPNTIELFELSILHEVGHFKTFKCFSDDAKAYNQLCKWFIDKIPFYHLSNKLYFNLPLERMATEWAINFIRKCPNRMKYLERNIYTDVQDFYKRVAGAES